MFVYRYSTPLPSPGPALVTMMRGSVRLLVRSFPASQSSVVPRTPVVVTAKASSLPDQSTDENEGTYVTESVLSTPEFRAADTALDVVASTELMMLTRLWTRVVGSDALKKPPRLLIAPCQVSSIPSGALFLGRGHALVPSLSFGRSAGKLSVPATPRVTKNWATCCQVAGSFAGFQ